MTQSYISNIVLETRTNPSPHALLKSCCFLIHWRANMVFLISNHCNNHISAIHYQIQDTQKPYQHPDQTVIPESINFSPFQSTSKRDQEHIYRNKRINPTLKKKKKLTLLGAWMTSLNLPTRTLLLISIGLPNHQPHNNARHQEENKTQEASNKKKKIEKSRKPVLVGAARLRLGGGLGGP